MPGRAACTPYLRASHNCSDGTTESLEVRKPITPLRERNQAQRGKDTQGHRKEVMPRTAWGHPSCPPGKKRGTGVMPLLHMHFLPTPSPLDPPTRASDLQSSGVFKTILFSF